MSKKVGYLACMGFNYGTILQAFALFQSIKKLGYDAKLLLLRPTEIRKCRIRRFWS